MKAKIKIGKDLVYKDVTFSIDGDEKRTGSFMSPEEDIDANKVKISDRITIIAEGKAYWAEVDFKQPKMHGNAGRLIALKHIVEIFSDSDETTPPTP